MKSIQQKVNTEPLGGDFTSFGVYKNNTGSNDGTPNDVDTHSDQSQFFDKIMLEAEITPNGFLESDANGFQLFEAFRKLTKPYKSYTALLTQTSTNDPVPTILGFNEIGTIVWTRTGVGVYLGTLSGAFVANKTWLVIASGFSGALEPQISRASANAVNLQVNAAGSPSDGALTDTSVEIRVYD